MNPAGGDAGPHLVDQVHEGTAAALGSLWVAVTRAGGAVGYARDAPEEPIRAAAQRSVEDVRAGRLHMLAIEGDDTMVGVVFLLPGDRATIAHRGQVLRLMVHPDRQGRGWGKALLDAVVAHGAALGLEQLLLSTRGGTTLPAFYAAQGWVEVGVFPGALRIGPDDVRDEHWFQLRLG